MRVMTSVIGEVYPDATGLVGMHWQPGLVTAGVMALLLSISLLSMSAVTEFIYFQF